MADSVRIFLHDLVRVRLWLLGLHFGSTFLPMASGNWKEKGLQVYFSVVCLLERAQCVLLNL